MAAARETLQSQLEHLQMKYVGTGHADIGKHEWLVNQHRDSLASYVGHPGLVAYVAAVENQAAGRVRYNMLQKMECTVHHTLYSIWTWMDGSWTWIDA